MPQDGDKDRFDLQRFVKAQEWVYERALGEMRRGHKQSHWMWFIFPQFDGLGFSPTTKLYSIKSITEAQAYLAHPTLGPRLLECTSAVLAHAGRSAAAIFGSPDDVKLRSSMTLFASVSPDDSVFHQVLGQFYGGQPDPQSLQLLASANKVE